ncbi:prestalk protein-like isoform X3 [Acipenser ruthenus]|uniref:prestalk protein-like isoform X3 n=1 Tax=Acipenser ruthenus TaxID=7906 RepID=UPI002740D877|nr:prestalk protein-like isoform X3 [Acipenser ruthenus]
MKVVLSILVLLYCAAQVQSLTCSVCPAGTADETTCTNTKVCQVGQTCFRTYTVSGSTTTVEKGCKDACVDAVNPQTSCCSTDNCNLQSLTCSVCPAGTADEATCTNTIVCPFGQTCFRTYTVSGSTTTVEKGCKAACVDAVNPQTSCCSTDKCNMQSLTCLMCPAGTADEATCTNTIVCPFGQTCFSTYTVSGSTITVEKGCKAACVDAVNPRTSCCSTDKCNQAQLRCYTCDKASDETTCAVNVCGLLDDTCKNTYEKTGTGPSAAYSVTKTCATKATCTEQLDAFPRVSCCTKASCNAQLACFTCTDATDESSCVANPCASETFCKSDYKVSSTGVPAVTKSCAADCKAFDNTADKNTRTTCCKTGYCNVQSLTCLMCPAGTADEATCTNTIVCPFGQTCFSTYTVSGSTITVEKGCKAACVDAVNPRTSCCSTDKCNQAQLRCYTCDKASDETTCAVNVCGLLDDTCKNTYEKTGTGPSAAYSVTKTCATKATCTEQLDAFPRVSCCTKASCNGLLACFTCTDATDESSCVASPCASGTFCKSDYKLSSTGVPAVTKSCAADCKAVDNTADKNTRTTCCKTGYCNENALSCNTCSNQADESKCVATACPGNEKICQSSYTLTAPGGQVTKTCAAAGCIPSDTVKCCGTSQCNVDALLCYTCDKQSVETACTAITACGPASGKCSSVYETAADGTITVTKSCEASRGACVTGTFGNKRTACCDTDLCNVESLTCFVCPAGTADEATCTNTKVCQVGQTCFSTYTGSGSSITVEKGCKAACAEAVNPRTSCCSTDKCNQAQLRCYTCDKANDETTCAVNVCGLLDDTCKNTYEKTGTGPNTAYSVTKTCATKATCTQQMDAFPRVSCCTQASCNGQLACFTCTDATDESSCVANPCASETFCKSDYKVISTGVPAVTKSCAADCKAFDNTADKNTRTTCCKTGYCNVESLTCFVCPAGTADEATCTSTKVCQVGQTCFSTYTGSGSSITVEKGCKAACADAVNPRTSCCSTDKCNQAQLRCYTCDKANDETTCAVNVCGLLDDTCKNTYEKTGTGPSAAYSVTKTCATKATCTQQLDAFPRVSCCTKASCNGLLACFTCTDATDESSCVASPCASEIFCKSDYKLSSTGVPAVTKSCAADCKAVDNTADKNTRTTCCKTGYCNENALSCNTCSNQADESKCVATACPGNEKICQSSYTLTAPGGQVTKTCAAAGTCTPSDTVKCCGTSQCNVDALLCYTCDKQSVETACTAITACGPASGKCSSVYETAADGTITVTKGCEASRGACVTGTVGNKRTACCDTDLCNVPKLSCLTCSATADETVCTSKACDVTDTVCDSVYDISKTPPTVVKKCAAACSAKTATTETKCCSTSDCNVQVKKCYTCNKSKSEFDCTNLMTCGVGVTSCFSFYDTTVAGTTVTKGCDRTCAILDDLSKRRTCCTTDLCNEPKLSCYTCSGLADEKQCTTVTACSATNKFCKTVRGSIAGKTVAVIKTCEDTCTASTSVLQTVECCQTGLCNQYKERGVNGSPSTRASYLLLTLPVGLLTALLKQTL